MTENEFVLPASGDWTPEEYAAAAVQSARWIGAMITLLSQVPSTAPAVAPMKLTARMMHARNPTLFTQALMAELATGTLLAARPAGSAD